MASTTLNAAISYNGGVAASLSGSATATQVGTHITTSIQTIGFADQEVLVSTEGGSIGDNGTIGYIMLKNNDVTNYIEIDFDDFDNIGDLSGFVARFKLRPGEFCALPLIPGKIVKAKAHTAPVDLSILFVEL